jgi:hypothetical protein
MADEQKDPQSASDYLAFLEGLEDHELEALVDGKAAALVASASTGYDLVGEIIMHERGEPGAGEAPWMEKLASLATQEEAVQVVADLEHLKSMIAVMTGRAMKRLRELHRETCDECREEHEQQRKARSALKRGLEAAKAAFAEALEEDDEPWKQSLDDEEEES